MWSLWCVWILMFSAVANSIPRNHGVVSKFRSEEERSKRRALADTRYYWTSRVIPYEISDQYTYEEAALIKASMKQLEDITCLDFRPRNYDDKDYIYISNKGGCWADQGRNTGKQDVSLGEGCLEKSTILHEFGHALGLSHEHQHPEREKVVQIVMENVKPSGLEEIKKLRADDHNYFGIDFDLDSIMMYSSRAYAKGEARTILTRDPSLQHRLDKYTKFLSYSDAAVINKMLKCKDLCGKKVSCPRDGYVDEHCKCTTPKSYFEAQCKDRASDTYCLDQVVADQCDKPAVAEKCMRTCDMCPMYHIQRKKWTGGCENKYYIEEKCTEWAGAGYCKNDKYKKYMVKWCAKACNTCGVNPDCLDAKDCSENYYKSDCQPGADYYDYVKENCKKFCGMAECAY